MQDMLKTAECWRRQEVMIIFSIRKKRTYRT